MKKLLFASTAALLMSGCLAWADDPMNQSPELNMQAIGSHAGLAAADVGYVPPEVIAAQRLAAERRMQRLAAARSVADVGYVPPEHQTPERQERRSSAYGPAADVGYVPPEHLAAQRLALLREEQRLAQRLAALRQARRSFYRPVADVGYVPPEYVAAQPLDGFGEADSASTSEAAFALAMIPAAAKATACPAE